MIKDYKQNNCLLIDLAVPSDKSISVEEYGKIDKNKDFEIEKIWHLKTTIMTIIIGALDMN